MWSLDGWDWNGSRLAGISVAHWAGQATGKDIGAGWWMDVSTLQFGWGERMDQIVRYRAWLSA